MVIIGGHRDGWGPGAADNVSGTVSVLEAARAVAELAKRGMRPKRTIVFATWDAEEWGLIGSTEYVEDDSLRLSRGAVAYLNQDVAAQGSRFGGGGSPSLARDAPRRRASGRRSEREGQRVRRWRRASRRGRHRRARDGRSRRRLGLRRLLQSSRHSDRRVGIRWRGRRVPLAVRQLRVDDKVRRPGLSTITRRRRASARRWCSASRTPTFCPTTTSSLREPCGATSRRSTSASARQDGDIVRRRRSRGDRSHGARGSGVQSRRATPRWRDARAADARCSARTAR